MMNIATRVLAIAVLLVGGGARAQNTDSALVQQVSGEASYASAAEERKVIPFMKVRAGDRFSLAAGARLSLVYMANGRQERWLGPARFSIGSMESKVLAGAPPEIASLPLAVAQKMMKIPEMIQIAKLGGIRVRGLKPKRQPGAEQEAELTQAKKRYADLRQRQPPEDISPELYLFAVLQEYLMYDEMQRVVEDMRRAQPESDDVRRLADWLQERRGGGR